MDQVLLNQLSLQKQTIIPTQNKKNYIYVKLTI